MAWADAFAYVETVIVEERAAAGLPVALVDPNQIAMCIRMFKLAKQNAARKGDLGAQ